MVSWRTVQKRCAKRQAKSAQDRAGLGGVERQVLTLFPHFAIGGGVQGFFKKIMQSVS